MSRVEVTKVCCRSGEAVGHAQVRRCAAPRRASDRGGSRARHRGRGTQAPGDHQGHLRPRQRTRGRSARGDPQRNEIRRSGCRRRQPAGPANGTDRRGRTSGEGLPASVVAEVSATPRPPGAAPLWPTDRSTEPGRSGSLEVTCPGSEAALALVGAARRMGMSAKSRKCAVSIGWSSATATPSARC